MALKSTININLSENSGDIQYFIDEDPLVVISFENNQFTFPERSLSVLEVPEFSTAISQFNLFKENLFTAFSDLKFFVEEPYFYIDFDFSKNPNNNRIDLNIKKENKTFINYSYDNDTKEITLFPRTQESVISVSEYLLVLALDNIFLSQVQNF